MLKCQQLLAFVHLWAGKILCSTELSINLFYNLGAWLLHWFDVSGRAREIDKSQSVRQFSKWSAISGRTYGNSRLEVYVRIYVTFEIWKRLFRGYRRECWCILPLPCLLNICLSFWMYYRRKIYFKQNKNTSGFPRINSCCFRQVHSSSSVRVQSAR